MSLFSLGLQKIQQALEKHLPTDEGTQLLMQAVQEYQNPHAQYALYALAQNHIITVPQEFEKQSVYRRDSAYNDFATMTQIKKIIMKAQW